MTYALILTDGGGSIDEFTTSDSLLELKRRADAEWSICDEEPFVMQTVYAGWLHTIVEVGE